MPPKISVSFSVAIFLLIPIVWADSPPAKVITIPQSEWAKGGTAPMPERMQEHTKGRITSIVLHHTQTPNEAPSLEKARLRGVQRYHIADKEWGDIAYHYLIGAAGIVREGREEKYQGDSGTSYDLDGRLLICVLGDFTRRMPEDPAMNAMLRLVEEKLLEHELKPSDVFTHRMVAATDCPGDALQKWFDEKGRAALTLE